MALHQVPILFISFSRSSSSSSCSADAVKCNDIWYLIHPSIHPSIHAFQIAVDTLSDEAAMMAMMGFGSFGGVKKAAPGALNPPPTRTTPATTTPAAPSSSSPSPSPSPRRSDPVPGPARDHPPFPSPSRSRSDLLPATPPTTITTTQSTNHARTTTTTTTTTGDDLAFPLSHELVLQQHSRIVSCVALGQRGSRLATGSYDDVVRLYNFSAMTTEKRSYKSLHPGEKKEANVPIVAVDWAVDGTGLLVVMATAQPLVYDREGNLFGEFPKGDMYVKDMKNTKVR